MSSASKLTHTLGVDVGGTFTDIVLVGGDGRVSTRKVSSSAGDYSAAIISGIKAVLAECGIEPHNVRALTHATTAATNAILTRSGASTGLITTEGFRDILEIGRLRMPRLYDLSWQKPEPLIERRHRLEVEERIGSTGQVLQPLRHDSVLAAGRKLVAEGVTSIAVCLINSYVNSEHELRARDTLQAQFPNVDISMSCEVLPEIKEYERTSTTVVSAYVKPVVKAYLLSLCQKLEKLGLRIEPLVMQSSGGVMSARAAQQRPIFIIESGPAAGAMAARELGRRTEYENLIAFDMGGTTAKVSLVQAGQIARASEYEVGGDMSSASWLTRGSGYIVRIPAVDIVEVGAGGGSIASMDKGGALHVGPASAGAQPGPVCYAAGGTEPTITDANVLLGYLNPNYLVGGSVKIAHDQAQAVIARKLASPLGLSVLQASYGVHQVANARMMRAMRSVTIEKGRDPRDFSLLAFGGSGPVHAAQIAKSLEMKKVVVPPRPGLFSAVGLLLTDVEHHYGRTCLRKLTTLDLSEIQHQFDGMREEAMADLEKGGYAQDSVSLVRKAELRYAGQSYELSLPLPDSMTQADFVRLEQAFGEEHERVYGHRASGDPVELVNLRLTAVVRVPNAKVFSTIFSVGPGAEELGSARRPTGVRNAYFGPDFGQMPVALTSRAELARCPARGPLIVEEYDATTLVPPDCIAQVDRWGNIVMQLGD